MFRSSTLVGLRHPEMVTQAAFRIRSVFESCDDLLREGETRRAVYRIVMASVPQLVFASFMRLFYLNVHFSLNCYTDILTHDFISLRK